MCLQSCICGTEREEMCMFARDKLQMHETFCISQGETGSQNACVSVYVHASCGAV